MAPVAVGKRVPPDIETANVKRPRYELVLVGDAPPNERTTLVGTQRRWESCAVSCVVGIVFFAGLLAWCFLTGKR